MPIKVKLVDNSSEVGVGVGSGAAVNLFKEALKRETKERTEADAYLQEEIDNILASGACYLLITENENGSIDVSILNKKEEVLDTKTITLTEKLIKNVELDYTTGQLVFTHFDDTTSTCDIKAIKEAIAAETTRAITRENEIEANLNAEIERAETAETNLYNDLHAEIVAETERAEAAEEALGQGVEEEKERAEAAEAEIRTNLANEITRAKSVENTLDTKIDDEVSRATEAEEALDTRLIQEVQDRIADVNAEEIRAKGAEADLDNAIQAEVTRATNKEAELNTKIEDEISRATSAEETLQDNIDAEESARISKDNELQLAIENEALTRDAADDTLQTNIDIEEQARIAGDTALGERIDAEASTREAADITLGGRIDTETSERQAADTNLQNKINEEEVARIAGDSALNTRIDNLDLDQVGADGSYIKLVSQENGKVSATAATFDTSIPAENPSNITAPTSKAVRDAINALDVNNITENLGRGKTLTALSEADGKISATAEDIQILSSQITDKQDTYDGTDSKVVTGKALKAALDTLDIDPISNTVGKTVATITEADGKVSATFQDIQIAESQVTNLETDLAELDDKLNYNVHLEGNTDEITYNGDTVTKTSPYRNLKTGVENSRSEVIHLANTTTAGLMSHNDYNTIVDLVDRVASLEGTSVRISYSDSDTPTAAQIKAAATAYLATRGITNPTDADYNGVSVRVTGTNHLWNYYANLQAYRDDGLDTVTTFTNSIAGIIKGAGETDGSIYAENDGTGSVYGWDALKTRVTNTENTLSSSLNNISYDSTNKKLTKTTNAGTTTDIVNLGINTSTGAETITVNTDTLNVITRDTAQEINGAKTFTVGITAPSIAPASGTLLLGLSGQSVQTNGNLIPDQTNYRDLGNVNRYWQNLYLDGSLKLKGTSTTYNILVDDTYNELRIQNGDSRYFTFNSGGIMPAGTRNLGSVSYKWQDIFINSALKNNNVTYGLTLPDMTSWTANKTVAVKEDLNLSEVGTDGSYIKLVSQTDGQLAATSQTFDTTIPQTGASTINAPTTAAVVNYVDTYGGKIDSISLDGTALTIDANKNVDIPVSLTTTASSESITVDSDSLNVVTRDTEQTISGLKTFENKIKINDETSTSILDNDWFIESAANYNLYVGRGTDRRFVFQNNLFAPNTYDVVSINLGEEHYKWNNAYIGGTINAGQVIKSTYGGATYALMKRGDDAYVICNQANNKGIRLNGGNVNALTPNTQDNYSLGTSADKWLDLHLSGKINIANSQILYDSNWNQVRIADNSGTLKYAFGLGGSADAYKQSIYAYDHDTSLGNATYLWKYLYLSGSLRDGKNNSYGLILPDTTSYTENKTLATIEDINEIVLSYADTMEILTSAIMPTGTTVENNNIAFPEGVTVSNHNINL